MEPLIARTIAWLRSVLAQLPANIRALYVERGDAHTPQMDHLVCFNAFGFESLADGLFDPANGDHVGQLGDFVWEPSGECAFREDEHPGVDWLTVLTAAAQSPEVKDVVLARAVQLVIGEHDGDVLVIA